MREKPANSSSKKKSKRGRSASRDPAGERKAWTFLVYLCGDDDGLEPFIDRNLEDLCKVGSQPDAHVLVQVDRRDGARRYILPEGGVERAKLKEDESFGKAGVNTGDPDQAIDFFLWGLEKVRSARVALIFSGLGINPRYVRQGTTLSASGPESAEAAKKARNKRLFSFCHDQTSLDELEAHELLRILEKVKEKRGPERMIDLVAFDMGAAAFVEIAYQMVGLAGVFVGAQGLLPNKGWPYDRLIARAQKTIANNSDEPGAFGRLFVDLLGETFEDLPGKLQLLAVDLSALPLAGRALDTLSLALMQNLGDWHVLEAVKRALDKTEWVSALEPDDTKSAAEWLPAVDLLQLLECLHAEITAQAARAPEEFGQKTRIEHLSGLLAKALNIFEGGGRDAGSRLILHSLPAPNRGLSIVMPRRGEMEIMDAFHLASSNYMELRFSQTVHWAALVGAFQLINEKPYVLWRLISSMLADVSGPARDALLERLISRESVVRGMKEQFQVLSSGGGLTLTLEPKMAGAETGAASRFIRLRLESLSAGATVAELENRIYHTTFDTTMKGLEQLLSGTAANPDAAIVLEALGRTLGEDVIQDLADRMNQEHSEAIERNAGAAPHLRLQIPRDLMRYPWELLHDRHGMLCERYALGRQVFMENQWTRKLPRRKPGPIRALVIGDPQFTEEFIKLCGRESPPWKPRQLPEAADEAAGVEAVFHDLKGQLAGLPALEIDAQIQSRVTVSDARQFLRGGGYDIIHYAGHACFNKSDPEAGGWLLSDGLLRAREIRNTLAWTGSPPWLVFANACEAAMDAEGRAQRYQSGVFGLASAFINQAVAAYIAPLWPVDDRVAAMVSRVFYGALLLDRHSVGESLRRARLAARSVCLPEADAVSSRTALSWAGYALYGDPSQRLLEALWSPHAR